MTNNSKWLFNYTLLWIAGFAISGIAPSSFATTQVSLDPNKRLSVTVSKDHMSRITVITDRITEVYGEESSYTIETDETKGQVFFKPLVSEPIPVTIVTEGGVTQDLTLNPTKSEACTILLKPAPQNPHQYSTIGGFHPSGSMRGLTPGGLSTSGLSTSGFQGQILQAVKLLVTDQAPVLELQDGLERTAEGFQVSTVKVCTLGAWRGIVYEVKNTTTTDREVHEQYFYKAGDLALSFRAVVKPQVLMPDQITNLYVIIPWQQPLGTPLP